VEVGAKFTEPRPYTYVPVEKGAGVITPETELGFF
jgi:hypothetical protein